MDIKMNKYILLTIGIILVFSIVLVSAGEIKKVKEIDQKKICEKETKMGVKDKKCKGTKDKIKLKKDSPLQMDLNTETGVTHIWM